MLLTTALLISAGIGAAGSLLGSAMNAAHQRANREDEQEFNAQEAELQRQWSSQEAETARQFSAEEAQKQRDFEKYMSDTSIQRQRADLEAAGYNPASVGITSGASTPSGANAATVVAPGGTAASSHSGYSNPSSNNYFGNLFSTSVSYAMNKDKKFQNEVIAKMYQSNASAMNELTNAIKSLG